ncbi:hypothetical protein BDQ17DRAFT_1362053 [Cyathus striatus]|nr:hypothetical protein BDQ17DRAFT_1362053 [Cyathus striatus]
MMRLLHWVLAPESYLPSSKFPGEWGMPPERTLAGDANCSILYSDVGSDFYHLCGPTTSEHGWVVDKPLSTEWNVSEWVKSAQGANKQWIWLDNRTLIESWKADARKIEEELSTHLGNETIFTFLPDRGVAEFQYQRSKGLWSQLEPLPVYWGICSTTSEVGLDDAHVTNEIVYNSQVAYATWAFGYSQEVVQGLIITRLRATKEGFPQLLERIIDYAKGYGLSKVEIWNLAPDFKEFAIQTGGRTYSLEEHLPAIKWYGAGGAKWVLNEKFCWC